MAREDEFRRVVAFLFQRSGRKTLSENELANAASHDLKWYAPKVARGLVAGLVRAGWLVRDEEGELEPAFDVKAVKIPMGFRPPAELPDEVPPPGSYASAPSGPQASAEDVPTAPPPSLRDPARDPATRTPAADPTTPPAAQPAIESPGSGPVAPTKSEDPADGPVTDLGALLAHLAESTGEDAGVWVQRLDAVVQKTDDGLHPEVALLLAAAKQGVDVSPWLGPVRGRLA